MQKVGEGGERVEWGHIVAGKGEGRVSWLRERGGTSLHKGGQNQTSSQVWSVLPMQLRFASVISLA